VADDSKPKALKKLQKEIPSRHEIGQRLAMAQLAEDYEAAMLSASLLEFMLRQAITTKFIPLGNDPLESIFSDAGNGPLCTFSAKIKLAFALGIISIETRLQIERVKEIRNHFAHHKDRVSFEHPSVKAECEFFKQLQQLRYTELSPKLMYVQACFYLASKLKEYIIML
jgi:hypothetical protein